MGGKGGFAGRGENWPTPQVGTGENSHGQISGDFRNRMEELLTAPMWMTPNVPNGGRHVPPELVASKGTMEDGTKRTVGLESQTKYWATPTSSDNSNRTTKIAPSHGISHGLVLAGQAASWATPKANDAEKRGNVAHRPHMPELVGQAQAWPTPKGTDGTKGGPNQAGSKGDLMLPSAAAQWPTPAARDSKGANSAEHALVTGGGRKHMDQLSNFVAHSSHLAQPMPDGQSSCESGPDSPQPSTKRLNPAFGEWLMGWPVGWTIAEPSASSASEMASWRSALQQQLCNLLDE